MPPGRFRFPAQVRLTGDQARPANSRVSVDTLTFSPSLMKGGTRISMPVSSLAGLVTLPLAVSPRAPGSVYGDFQFHMGRQLQPDGIAIVFMQFDDGSLHEEVQGVADHLTGESKGFKALLVQKVGTISIAVEIRCLDHLKVRLLELVTGLEGLVKDGAGEEVAHLQADQGLAAAGGGRVHLRFQAHRMECFQPRKTSCALRRWRRSVQP